MAIGEVGDFSSQRLKTLYASDLANGLGNLVSRLATLCEKADYGTYKALDEPSAPAGYHDATREYRFDSALGILWREIASVNQAIGEAAPWNALRNGNAKAVKNQLTRWLDSLSTIAYWLEPFLPGASCRIREVLAASPVRRVTPLFPRSAKSRGPRPPA